MYNQNYCKDQKHVHELTGSTKIFNECGDCHNHRFCTLTGEAIYHNEHDHFHIPGYSAYLMISPSFFSLLAPLVGLRVQLVVPGKAAIRLYLLNPFDRTDCIFIRSKGSETEISLAAWPEPGARRSYHIGPFQQIVKEFPGSHPFRRLQPDIRRVHAS